MYVFYKSIRHYINATKTILELIPPTQLQKSAFSTDQMFIALHSLGLQTSFWQVFLGVKKLYSLELVATQEKGIKYCLRIYKNEADIVKKILRAYIPQITINEINDYLPNSYKDNYGYISLNSFHQSNHFVLPLEKQPLLNEHDPITYITNQMTKLETKEMLVYQIIITPLIKVTHKKIINEIGLVDKYLYEGFDITEKIHDYFKFLPRWSKGSTTSKNYHDLTLDQRNLQILIREKIDKEMFEASMRVFIVQKSKQHLENRGKGFLASLSSYNTSYQSLVPNGVFPLVNSIPLYWNYSYFLLRNRLLGINYLSNLFLNVSELSSLLHFPYYKLLDTEDLVKVLSPDLPSPLSFKRLLNFDVIFGQSNYANVTSPIGLSEDERSRHTYIIGQTGSGKSTVLYHMAKDDIQKGKGVAVIDPHGDLITDLLSSVPENRFNDVVYINPFDIKYPININLLELTPDLDDDEHELEKEVVTESIVTIFRRLFSKEENIDSHRIEYILRNAIYTAFYVKDATIFTVNKLLINTDYRRKILQAVNDEYLQDFWKNEFGKAGDFQVFKMISGVTAKIGRFLFSPTASRMLESPKSTINFDNLLDQGKIILCNLSEGKLGEDTSQLIGTTIITKIHLALLKRARIEKALRQPFYLYIDEFQNFATSSFTKLLSGGRKYGLHITIAQQSTAQQAERKTVDVILGNIGTMICFRTASPVDEDLMLTQMSPLVKKGNIGNLPRYRFYMKLGSLEPQEPFSGTTLRPDLRPNLQKISAIIAASQKNYARVYIKSPKLEFKPTENLKYIHEDDVTLI